MRLWLDTENRLLTDDQLLRLIAYHGSLEDTLQAGGNIRLISSTEGISTSEDISTTREDSTLRKSGSQSQDSNKPARKLSDFLAQEQC